MLIFVKSVLLCGSVRERMQEARWGEYLSQNSQWPHPQPLSEWRGE